MTMLNFNALPTPGEMWDEQRGIFICITPLRRAIVAPVDERTLFKDVQWGKRGQSIDGAHSDWDGAANTLAMAAAGSQLAQNIAALELDGMAGFYLPARHELRMIKLVAPQLIVDEWHWSSTQYSADDAWFQGFDGGGQSYDGKHRELRARAIRSLKV